jgi:hypothetical protein
MDIVMHDSSSCLYENRYSFFAVPQQHRNAIKKHHSVFLSGEKEEHKEQKQVSQIIGTPLHTKKEIF